MFSVIFSYFAFDGCNLYLAQVKILHPQNPFAVFMVAEQWFLPLREDDDQRRRSRAVRSDEDATAEDGSRDDEPEDRERVPEPDD